MNAIQIASRRVVSGRRLFSVSAAIPKKPVPDVYQYSVKKAWFSDSSTYPLLVTLGVAGCFLVGMSVNAFTHYKDVKINPSLKHQTIRDWGEEPTFSFTKRMASNSYHNNPEGLGVDHNAWTKAKN